MESPIIASFRWAPQELLLAHRVHMRHSSMGRKIRRAVFVTGPLAILFGSVILIWRGFHPVGLVCILMGSALLASPLFARRIVLKHYAQRPDREMLVTWEFYTGHIASKTEASSASLEWRMISRALQTADGFLLYQSDQLFNWIPIHAFREPKDVEAFAQLAKSKVQHFDHVT